MNRRRDTPPDLLPCLFVGGPWNGQWLNVYVTDRPVAAPDRNGEIFYRPNLLSDGQDGEFVVYAPDGMSTREIFACLIDGYRRGAELAAALPKTADGVPVTPGMTLYGPGWEAGVAVESVRAGGTYDRLFSRPACQEFHTEHQNEWTEPSKRRGA